MKYWIKPSISQFVPVNQAFDFFMHLQGEIFRFEKNRKTLRFKLNHQPYFAKIHFGIGIKEVIKNLIQLKLPVISAKNEWLAIHKLHQLNIATMNIVAFGERGFFPWSKQSFLITEELQHTISLEDFCTPWNKQAPNFKVKIKILSELARTAKTIHENGINHRDFYLCHFLLEQKNSSIILHVIDLHRAQIRAKVPRRWLIKDLAGLYFSAMDIGLTKRDILRFITLYSEPSLKRNWQFWADVSNTAEKLYLKVHGKKPYVVCRSSNN